MEYCNYICFIYSSRNEYNELIYDVIAEIVIQKISSSAPIRTHALIRAQIAKVTKIGENQNIDGQK